MTDNFPCPRCQVGHYQRSTAPYLRVRGNLLVNVPDMPVWTCDICGYYEFEHEAVARLDTLMSARASGPKARRTKPRTQDRPSRRIKP